MGDPDRLDVAAAALDIVALRALEPAPVLAALTDAASRSSGLAAGVALAADLPGGVRTAGPAGSRAALLAGFGEGPGAESARSGRPVSCPDLVRERPRWLSFVAKADAVGVTGAWALPIRRGTDHFGALLLLGSGREGPDLSPVGLLADAAAVALLQAADLARVTEEGRQLQAALTSRVLVEQAKGIVAEHAGIGVDDAFGLLRSHARRSGLRLADVAGGIARREVDPASVVGRPGTS